MLCIQKIRFAIFCKTNFLVFFMVRKKYKKMDFSSYSFIDIFISIVLGLIMFGIGLSLTPDS